jgi:hypothetical protein
MATPPPSFAALCVMSQPMTATLLPRRKMMPPSSQAVASQSRIVPDEPWVQ